MSNNILANGSRCGASRARWPILVVACACFAALYAFRASRAIAATTQTPTQFVIEDNDFRGPGGSDLQSVLPLLANPHVTVLGFTVVTGDDWENAEAAALLRFLEVAGRPEVPVVNGAVYPLVNSVALWRLRERQYGRIAWKGAWGGAGSIAGVPDAEPPVPPLPQGAPTIAASPERAADFLIRQVHAHPHAVTIVAAGPLTNIALAIRLDPSFAAATKRLVFMGGVLDANMKDVTGNSAFSEDFNFIFDPEAAHIVLTANWPQIVGLGNVAGDVQFSPALVDQIAAKPTRLTRYLRTFFEPLPMWDEITTAVAVDPTLVQTSVDAYMDVDLADGVDYGRAHVWPDALAPKAMGVRRVTIVQTFNERRFLDEFVHAAQALP